MTPEVIVFDSSGLISLLIETDSNHAQAVHLAQSLQGRHIDKILPAEVLAETINILGKKFGNATAIHTGHAILARNFFIPYSEPEFLTNALNRLVTLKATVSFIDCLVMNWADHYHTTTIFGFDADFATNGYKLP